MAPPLILRINENKKPQSSTGTRGVSRGATQVCGRGKQKPAGASDGLNEPATLFRMRAFLADILYLDNGGSSGFGYKDLRVPSPRNSKGHSVLLYRQALTGTCSLGCHPSTYSSFSQSLFDMYHPILELPNYKSIKRTVKVLFNLAGSVFIGSFYIAILEICHHHPVVSGDNDLFHLDYTAQFP